MSESERVSESECKSESCERVHFAFVRGSVLQVV